MAPDIPASTQDQIIRQLSRLQHSVDDLHDITTEIRSDISGYRVRQSAWGILGGIIGTIIVITAIVVIGTCPINVFSKIVKASDPIPVEMHE